MTECSEEQWGEKKAWRKIAEMLAMTVIVKTMDGLFSHIIFFIPNILKANMKYFWKNLQKQRLSEKLHL